jgi:hypothetical protein
MFLLTELPLSSTQCSTPLSDSPIQCHHVPNKICFPLLNIPHPVCFHLSMSPIKRSFKLDFTQCSKPMQSASPTRCLAPRNLPLLNATSSASPPQLPPHQVLPLLNVPHLECFPLLNLPHLECFHYLMSPPRVLSLTQWPTP